MSNKTAPLIDETTGVRADASLVPPDAIPDFGATLTPVDRSTLEAYATCPAQARFVELGRVLNRSHAMDVGNAVHDAFSEVTQEYLTLAVDGEVETDMLADAFRGRLLASRPDLQPDAIDAAWYSAWPWAKFLAGTRREGGGIAPKNILRFDGGLGKRTGQMAGEFRHLGAAPTTEVDFLHAGPAKEVLHEIDWKSGRTSFSAGVIGNSFQFQMHAWLVFGEYAVCEQLEVSVWHTRRNEPTKPVTFYRDDLPKFERRVMEATTRWYASRGREPEACETWPSVEACGLCPAAKLCPITPPESVASNPQRFVGAMLALDTKLAAMAKEASLYVDITGEDIVTEDGLAFGRSKPKTERKPTAALYSIKGE